MHNRRVQDPRFSAAYFAKFCGTICEILRNSVALLYQIPYIPRPVGVVLTDNTSKYNEFIVTCNMKTHYIRPLMMKISSRYQKRLLLLKMQHSEHTDYLVSSFNKGREHRTILTMTRFRCFINGRIKKEPEKP